MRTAPYRSQDKLLFIGLGNRILRDDGAGLALAEKLRLMALPWLSVETSERGGFELIDLMTGYERVILADSLTMPTAQPGLIRMLELADCSGSPRLSGSHDLALNSLFQLARQMGIPMPSQITIFGIETIDTDTFGENLSPEVAEAVEGLARHIRESGQQD